MILHNDTLLEDKSINNDHSSISMLNSFMIEALCFNTSNGFTCLTDSFSIDRGRIHQLQKERLFNYKEPIKINNSNQTFNCKKSSNIITQVNSIMKSKLHQISIQHNESKRCDEISKLPEKILDAPNLIDDYYLNLLDWGSRGILGVCLGNAVYLWNSETNETNYLMDNSNNICSVNWMDNGVCIAIGLSNGLCELYDAERMIKIRTLDGHNSSTRISSLAWNNYILSTGGKDSKIINHDVREKIHIIDILKGHSKEVCSLKWSPDGEHLASGGNDNILCIWELKAKRTNRMLNRINFDLDKIDECNYNTFTPKFCLTQHCAAVKGLAWCPYQRNVIASGGGTGDKSIKIWNSDNGTLINSINTGSQVCSLLFNRYERELISTHGFSKNQIAIWEYPKMNKIVELMGHMNRVLYTSMSPDGTILVSGASDETLRFWRINEEDKIRKYNGDIAKKEEYRKSKGEDSIIGDLNIR